MKLNRYVILINIFIIIIIIHILIISIINFITICYWRKSTTRKYDFNESLFSHYSRLKPLLSHLSRVAVSHAKPSPGFFFLNLKKSLSKPLLNTIGLRTSVKYHRFQNLR